MSLVINIYVSNMPQNAIPMQDRRQRIQPIVAFRALRRLIADPEQTHEVFEVIRALSGPALMNELARFRQTEVGQRVLRDKIDLVDTLKDREALATLPANTLGRHYLSFVTNENISAEGLVDASENGEYDTMSPDLKRFAERQRDMHDLWHTLSQYGRDELGEVCLLAFTYAQSKNRGIGVICLAGAQKVSEHYGTRVFKAVWRAYRAGKTAAWLPGADWEALLKMPIDEVRQTLGIAEPELYRDLRERGAVPA